MESEQDLPMHYGAKGKLFQYAKEMRKNLRKSERALWKILNGPAFSEHKFRRQHPIDKFIADFYSHKLKLVIEVDGGYHANKKQREFDAFRDKDMNEFSISVIRLSNDEVLNNASYVYNKLKEYIEYHKPK